MNARFGERLGRPAKQKERSLWVIGDAREAFGAAAPVIESIAGRQGRLVVILTAPESLRDWLTSRFPFAVVQRAPVAQSFAVSRYLRRSNFRAVLALEGAALPPALVGGILAEGLTLVALSGRPDGAPPPPAVFEAAEAAIAVDPAGAGAAGAVALPAAVDLIGAFLARDVKARRRRAQRGFGPAAALLAAIERPAGRRLFARRLSRIENAEALRAELGAPRTVLCLGNGPSSEDGALKNLAHEALFRVNHSWAGRGLLTRPDVVFTGGAKTMETLDGAIFGVQSEPAERRLVAARALNPRRGATRFFRAGAVSPFLADYPWGAFRPTNGASMLAVAVALAPEKLVVAGIDLFRHPDGAYPGDAATPNAFAPAHDAAAELAFLLALFARYDGELVILGDVLRAAWEARAT